MFSTFSGTCFHVLYKFNLPTILNTPMLFISSYISGKNHCRYRPPKHPQYDLALVKVIKPIKFSDQVMPICLPMSTKFPDHKGTVYVAGWGLHHEAQEESKCTTGDKGPDPFSKCKFPFFWHTPGSIAFHKCVGTDPPSQHNKGCKELLKLKQRKNESANMLDKNYGRGSTYIYIIEIVSRVWNLSFLFQCESCYLQ